MMVGGVAALMLQMLHPRVLAGVWDHSGFRNDMNARLRGTARFIAQTTFETRATAEAQIARVRHIHDKVSGTLPDGTPYSANDPRLLAWVHVAEATSFLAGWMRYGEPGMRLRPTRTAISRRSRSSASCSAPIPCPRSRAEADALIADFLPEMKADGRSREVLHLLLSQRAPSLALIPFQALTMNAAIELLPDWARRMHGFVDAYPHQACDPHRHTRYRRDGALGATRLATAAARRGSRSPARSRSTPGTRSA